MNCWEIDSIGLNLNHLSHKDNGTHWLPDLQITRKSITKCIPNIQWPWWRICSSLLLTMGLFWPRTSLTTDLMLRLFPKNLQIWMNCWSKCSGTWYAAAIWTELSSSKWTENLHKNVIFKKIYVCPNVLAQTYVAACPSHLRQKVVLLQDVDGLQQMCSLSTKKKVPGL